MDIITIGEMVIDFFPGTEERSYVCNAGGAPANVAISVARNGFSAGMFCKLGDDDFGRFLLKTLYENHVIPLSPELCREATTTMAFVSLTPEGERSFTFVRKPGADMFLSLGDIREDMIIDCKIVHGGSCSLSAGTAKNATIYALKRGHELGKLVSFDINYRNLMWNDDRKAASEAIKNILPYVDLLKLSEEEEDMIGGRDCFFTVMKKNGISAIIETLGENGAECFFEEHSFIIPGRRVGRIADTTGAGDAFWGSFLSRLLQKSIEKKDSLNKEVLKEAIKYGNIGGSLCVEERGAIESLPTKKEIETYMEVN